MAAYWRETRRSAKGRWVGRRMGDILQELGPGARCPDPEHVVRQNDTVEYAVHMHEPPCPDPPLEIIHETEELLVVNKASGIPTHPTVNYYKNTVTEFLGATVQGTLQPCYRLDRLTSGILCLAKGRQALAAFNAAERTKVYYAKVQGRVEAPLRLEFPILHYNGKRGYAAFLQDYKLQKAATTLVEPVRHDGDTSTIVRCVPLTGRTHQIRRHLALAGHPIANDELYLNGVYKRLYNDPTEANFDAANEAMRTRQQAKATGHRCSECGTELYDAAVEQIWLHCAEYTVGENKYRAGVHWLDGV